MGSGSRLDRKKSVSARKRKSQGFSLGKLLGVVVAVIAVVLVCVVVYRASKLGLDRMATMPSRPAQPSKVRTLPCLLRPRLRQHRRSPTHGRCPRRPLSKGCMAACPSRSIRVIGKHEVSRCVGERPTR